MVTNTELSEKQIRFVQEYVVDQNGKQAAIRAGYSPKTAEQQASRLLSKVKVKALLKQKTKAIAEKTETDAEWVIRRLKEEANDVSPFATHAARIRALELIGKIHGVFESDNNQRAPTLTQIGRIELVGVKTVRQIPRDPPPDVHQLGMMPAR